MKKILFLLVFIPLVSFGQTYDEIMSINSLDTYKKVVIENGYELTDIESDEDGWVNYGYMIKRDSINGDKSSIWTSYNAKDHRWSFWFSRTTLLGQWLNTNETADTPYDLIVEEIKEKCKYYKILNYKEVDYVAYSCAESSYKGKIGFMVTEGQGVIRHFPDE